MRVEYPWHPLFGRRLPAREGGRRRGEDTVYVEEQPGFLRELPAWMCDPVYCARLEQGAPMASLEALMALSSVLCAMSVAAETGASSGDPTLEETIDATPPVVDAIVPSLRGSLEPATTGAADARPAGDAGRSPAGGDGRPGRRGGRR